MSARAQFQQGLFATYDALSFCEGAAGGNFQLDFGPFVISRIAGADRCSGLIQDIDPSIVATFKPNPYYTMGGPGSPVWVDALVVSGATDAGVEYVFETTGSGGSPLDILSGNAVVEEIIIGQLIYGLSKAQMRRITTGILAK